MYWNKLVIIFAFYWHVYSHTISTINMGRVPSSLFFIVILTKLYMKYTPHIEDWNNSTYTSRMLEQKKKLIERQCEHSLRTSESIIQNFISTWLSLPWHQNTVSLGIRSVFVPIRSEGSVLVNIVFLSRVLCVLDTCPFLT